MPPKWKTFPHDSAAGQLHDSETKNAKRPRADQLFDLDLEENRFGEPLYILIWKYNLSVFRQSLLMVLNLPQGVHHALEKAAEDSWISSETSSGFKQQCIPDQ